MFVPGTLLFPFTLFCHSCILRVMDFVDPQTGRKEAEVRLRWYWHRSSGHPASNERREECEKADVVQYNSFAGTTYGVLVLSHYDVLCRAPAAVKEAHLASRPIDCIRDCSRGSLKLMNNFFPAGRLSPCGCQRRQRWTLFSCRLLVLRW